jgi:hypothetical protein
MVPHPLKRILNISHQLLNNPPLGLHGLSPYVGRHYDLWVLYQLKLPILPGGFMLKYIKPYAP